jgi:O-antigen/teichoic acid export membrane protein
VSSADGVEGRFADDLDAQIAQLQRLSRGPKSTGAALRKRLLKGSGWVFLAMAFSTVLGLVVNGLLARLLSHDAFGGYFLLFSIATIGAQIGVVGMDRAVVRTVSQGLGTERPGRARAAVRNALFFGGVGSLLVAAVLLIGVGSYLANHVYHSTLVAGSVALAAGWVVAMVLQTLVAETFRGFQRFWQASLFGGLAVDAMSVMVFGFLWLRHAHPSLAEMVLITISVMSVSLLIGAYLLSKRVRRLGHKGDMPPREILSLAWPFLVTNILTTLVGTGIDITILAHYVARPQLALYGAATKLVFFVAAPFTIVSLVVPPIISEQHAQGHERRLEKSLREVATLASIPAALVLLTFLFFGGPIMSFVYGGSFFHEGAKVLAILGIARLYAVVTGNSGTLLMMTGNQKTMMRITSISGVYAVVSELLLAPRFGIVGVAVGTATAQFLQNTLQLVFGKRKVGIWTNAELSFRPLLGLIGK